MTRGPCEFDDSETESEIPYNDWDPRPVVFVFTSINLITSVSIAMASKSLFRVQVGDQCKLVLKHDLYAYLDALAHWTVGTDTLESIELRIPFFPIRYLSPFDFAKASVQDTIAEALEVWMK